MKKVLFMILALSSVTFAGVPNTGNNTDTSATETSASASINVNVSANVTDALPNLLITDEKNIEISSVSFHHELKTEKNYDVNLNKQITVRAHSKWIVDKNADKQLNCNFTDSSLNLTNTTDSSTIITANLSSQKQTPDINNKYIPVIIFSKIAGTNQTSFTEGEYLEKSTILAFTINKTAKGEF